MAIPLCISRFAPLIHLYLLLLSLPTSLVSAVNITRLLSPYSDLSDFSDLLSTTAVAADLFHRTSITLLAVPNSFLRSSDLVRRSSSINVADVIRYHVLLQYLSLHDLRRYPPSGKLITTLFQTTGRAADSFGSVNITHDPYTDTTTVQSSSVYPQSTNNATVISPIVTLPYNVSIFTVNSLIIPYGFDLMTSESRPPLGLNITKALIDGHNFNVAASMFSASGVVQEFESEKGGAGITLFVPTDDAFSYIPVTENFQSLPADQKADVLRFHVLLSYYPLGSLESIVNPFQPTLATEDKGAGRFTLNISRVNGSVAISSGIVEASVTQTVFDENPIAIFGISRVLLPKEIFRKKENAESPSISPPPPNSSPELNGPSSSSPGLREEMHSTATVQNVNLGLYLYTGLLYVLLI
ncbi:fasciclin-like arabinogalactan protein 4 [Cynara cardunculus var. scolymus]|uniref:fasciclin-like arabinogalactan protein 4 n=1 Tax=Cynara cardunculus var. scolymus TaxID=59895 RepID=UPI000D62D73A|nr:fasciclin-like arabinogalactan protein 4 [Cynara cardunculus var. scolymus]